MGSQGKSDWVMAIPEMERANDDRRLVFAADGAHVSKAKRGVPETLGRALSLGVCDDD